MTGDLNWDILDRYFSGECAPDEVADIERWARAEPSRAQLLTSVRAVWERTGVVPPRFDVDAAWQTVRPGLAERPPRMPLPPLRIGPSGASRAFRYAAAAAVLLAAAGGVLWWRTLRQPPAAQPAAVGAMREYATPRGQRAAFQLEDGTQVVLGVASRLRVPADYGVAERRVHLEGEAYFEVTHDSTRRFFVHTATAITEDLGTKFTVRAYLVDSGVQVVVAEGKVALQRATSAGDRGAELATPAAPTVLTQGQLGRMDAAGAIAVQQGIDLDRYLAWTEGRLVFKNVPLAEALPELSRWYDLDFRLGDRSLGERRLTASFTNQPNAEVLAVLALSLDVRQERHGRTVTFYPKRRA